MTIPPGNFNADSVNQSFKDIGADAYQVVGDVKVGSDNTAYLKVNFNNKEYTVTVGSDFVAGFKGSDTTVQQKFAQQLSQLLLTMHENPSMTSALIDEHHFTYNGKAIELDKVDHQIASIERNIETKRATLPGHDADISAKTDAKNAARREVEAFDAKRSFALFGKGDIKKADMADFEAANQKLEKAATELYNAHQNKTKSEQQIKDLEEDLKQHQIARKFKDAVTHGGSSGMRAVVTDPTATAAPAATTSTTPTTATAAAPTLTVTGDGDAPTNAASNPSSGMTLPGGLTPPTPTSPGGDQTQPLPP